MRPLYAVQFEVARSDGTTPATLRAEVLSRVLNWISEWYLSRKGVKIHPPLNVGPVSPVFGHDLEVLQDVSDESQVSHSVVSWSYPEDNDGNLFWSSRVEIGEFGGLVEFSYQLSFDSTQYLIAPVEFSLRRPRIVGDLLQEFTCSCGGATLSLDAKEIEVGQVQDFVTDRLLAHTRRLPIVLVSRTTLSDKLIIDPTRLSSQLAGIAETYCLADKWASFALTDCVGKLYSCYNGAVRVYWPAFYPSGTPVSQVYLPESLNDSGERLTDNLFRQFASISAFRFARGPVTTDAWEHLFEKRRRETEELKAAASERGDLDQLLELADIENRDIKKKNDQLQDEVRSLQARLELAQDNFRAIQLSHGEIEWGTGPTDAKSESEGLGNLCAGA